MTLSEMAKTQLEIMRTGKQYAIMCDQGQSLVWESHGGKGRRKTSERKMAVELVTGTEGIDGPSTGNDSHQSTGALRMDGLRSPERKIHKENYPSSPKPF